MDLRILFVEDSPDDVELMLRRLRDAGITPHWARVETEAALREALAGEHWQLALVDYNLPGFGGPEALAVLAEMAPDVPAITVSGAIDEDTAVTTIKAGAEDYVLKNNLTRLAPAAQRVVEGAELRRQRRQALEQARQTMYAVEHASQAIVYVSEDGVVQYANEAACRLAGLPHPVAAGLEIWSWFPSVGRERWAQLWRIASQHPIVDTETTLRLPSGEERLISVTLDHHERGEDSFLIAYARDVTEQRRVEGRAEEVEALYRRVVETSVEGIWVADAEWRTTFVNSQMAQMLGYEPEEMLGRVVADFLFDEDLADHAAQSEARARGLPASYQRRYGLKDGGYAWFGVSATPLMDPQSGEFLGSFAMLTDITEHKRAEEKIRRHAEQLRRTVEGAVLAMGHIVEARDPYTAGHERRVAELATAIAAEMGMDGEALDLLRVAGLIHDIGKTTVPAEILAKPGRLSEVEFDLIKQHPASGFAILAVIDFGGPVAEMVLQHHERLDGSGYPRGLSGDDIVQEARILAVADVVEAMSSHRPYRAAIGMEAALAEVREHAGVKYDADVVATCVRVVEQKGFEFTP